MKQHPDHWRLEWGPAMEISALSNDHELIAPVVLVERGLYSEVACWSMLIRVLSSVRKRLFTRGRRRWAEKVFVSGVIHCINKRAIKPGQPTLAPSSAQPISTANSQPHQLTPANSNRAKNEVRSLLRLHPPACRPRRHVHRGLQQRL